MDFAALLINSQLHIRTSFSCALRRVLDQKLFFSWVCREGTNFSCVAAQECFILHLNYTGF